jgi:hypothetical protein
MSDDRRSTVTVELKNRRLGLYLEPVSCEFVPVTKDTVSAISSPTIPTHLGKRGDERWVESEGENVTLDSRGAFIVRFEGVDGSPGEAEASGLLRMGMLITHVNDTYVQTSPFASIVSMLVNLPRPIRLTFRDPEIHEFRDRYGFLRTKLHADRETAYFTATAAASKKNDMEWIALLNELGQRKGASFGVLRLMRDACGEVTFPVEPAVRMNAMSPMHGRMAGISSASMKPEESRSRGSGSKAAMKTGDDEEEDIPMPVIDIYRRCWCAKEGTIGVPQPPGLVVALPGEIPKGKPLEKLQETLRRLVLYGGIPTAYRSSIWFELSGGHAKAALHPPGYYQSLTKRKTPAEAAYAIGKDLDRTFPGHSMFESKEGIAALRRVLSALSIHNPEIGYAQSLNFRTYHPYNCNVIC